MADRQRDDERNGAGHHAAFIGGSILAGLGEKEKGTIAQAIRKAKGTPQGVLKAIKESGPSVAPYLALGILPSILDLVRHLYSKKDTEKKASPFHAMAHAYMLKRAAANLKPQGALRNSMAVAYNATPPGPQVTPVGGPQKIKPHQTGVKAKPPSKARFFNDQAKAGLGYGGDRMGVPSTGQQLKKKTPGRVRTRRLQGMNFEHSFQYRSAVLWKARKSREGAREKVRSSIVLMPI